MRGALTEVLSTYDTGDEQVHVVVVPGNPGAAGTLHNTNISWYPCFAEFSANIS